MKMAVGIVLEYLEKFTYEALFSGVFIRRKTLRFSTYRAVPRGIYVAT